MTDSDHGTDRLEERLREEAARFFRTLPKDPPTHRLLALRRTQVRRRSAAGGIGVLSITLAALALAIGLLRSHLTEGPVHHARGGGGGGGAENGAAVEPDATPTRPAEGGLAERRSAAESLSLGRVTSRPPSRGSEDDQRETAREGGPRAWQNDGPTYLIPVAVLRDRDALPEEPAAPIAAQPANWHELGAYERQAARELLRLDGGNSLTEAL